jgi:hypothetical protein
MAECHFWANVMLRQSRVHASRVSPAQRFAGFEGGLFQNRFKGYIFSFLGHLVGGKVFEEFASETNLKKKRSAVWYFHKKRILTNQNSSLFNNL